MLKLSLGSIGRRYFASLGMVNSSFSATTTIGQSAGEKKLIDLMWQRFPKAVQIIVKDTSGGCGDKYRLEIETVEFAGIPKGKQHKMVTEALKIHVYNIHGIYIITRIPK